MTKVFISYAKEDTEWARRLEQHLARYQIEYFDFQGRRSGQWVTATEIELLKADVFVALLSRAYENSYWCGHEKSFALRREKNQKGFIHVLKVRNDIPDDKTVFLGNFNYTLFDCTGENPDEQIVELVDHILRKSTVNVLPVPVSVYAMTTDEAKELIRSTDPDVQEILATLSVHNLNDPTSRYGDSRNSWKPVQGEETIEEIIWSMVEVENRRSKNIVHPVFYSDEMFSNDRWQSARTKIEFTPRSGILVIDAISLFHKGLREKLPNSFSTNTAIVVILPLGLENLKSTQFVIGEKGILKEGLFDTISQRFFYDYDAYCHLGVGDIWAVKHWLAQVLPAASKKTIGFRPDDERRQLMQQTMPSTNVGNRFMRG